MEGIGIPEEIFLVTRLFDETEHSNTAICFLAALLLCYFCYAPYIMWPPPGPFCQSFRPFLFVHEVFDNAPYPYPLCLSVPPGMPSNQLGPNTVMPENSLPLPEELVPLVRITTSLSYVHRACPVSLI